MNILEEIELKFNFKYPELYKQLYTDGMLYTREYGSLWMEKEYPKIKETPTLLLYENGFNLIPTKNLSESIEEVNSRHSNTKIKLIPFGFYDPSGDQICFYLNTEQENDISIVFVWSDASEFYIEAKNLQDYIFKKMLQIVLCNPFPDYLLTKDYKTNALNILRTHSKYLTKTQQEIITEIYNREKVIEYTNKANQKYTGLLTEEEYTPTVKRIINFPFLNQSFPLY